MQTQISWLLQKPADLDLHCLQRQGISGFSRTRVTTVAYKQTCIDYIQREMTINGPSLTLVLLNPICPALANSVDPDQLASEEAN